MDWITDDTKPVRYNLESGTADYNPEKSGLGKTIIILGLAIVALTQLSKGRK